MTEREALEQLEDSEVVPCAQASLDYCKELQRTCLDADIPAMIARPESCDTGGCSPRVQLLVREQDLERVATMFNQEWLAMAEREGTVTPSQHVPIAEPEGELPCPACGTAAPLVSGACSDCGLVLE